MKEEKEGRDKNANISRMVAVAETMRLMRLCIGTETGLLI